MIDLLAGCSHQPASQPENQPISISNGEMLMQNTKLLSLALSLSYV